METAIRNSLIRLVALWLVQVFILRFMTWGWGGSVYLNIHLFPLFIAMLPLRTPRVLMLLIAFVTGLLVDVFYGTIGVHAAALVFTAWVRELVLQILQPREGYGIKSTPTHKSLGTAWFFRYVAILWLLHLLFFYTMDAFTIAYLGQILLKTLVSWVVSVFVVLIVAFVFNPEA